MPDSAVIIQSKMDNKGIVMGVRNATREISKISKAYDSTIASIRKQEIALSDLQRKYNALMEGQKTPASLSAMQTSLRNTEREIREVEKANKDLFAQYEAAAERVEALRPFGETDTQFIKAQEQADILFQRLEPVEQKFAELNAKAQDLRQSIAGVKMTPETSAEAQLLADKIKLATENINKSHGEAASLEMDLKLATAEAERLKGALGESGGAESARASIDGIGQAAQTAAKVSTSAFKTIAGMIGGIAKGAGKAAKGVLGVAKNILTLGASSRKASGGVNGLFKRLLQLGAAAFVFNVLRKGLRELSEGLRNALMANQEFAASFNAIKVNLLTAFSPIWEILEPAIVRFMQLLAQFTAVLARFMALLFGKTYTQARASAKGLNEQAKGMDKVGAAAKKNEKLLASFDEIQKQNAETVGGGGAGAEGLDFDFKEPPALAPWLEELANKLKGIFTEIDPDYWFNLGAALATWIADALNSIPWDKVQEWARVFAINLASFLGGFLADTALWTAIGHTIAQALNTVLIFAYNFLITFPWGMFGTAVATGLNQAVKEFDWVLLGKTFAAGINAAIDFLLNFVRTFDWSEFGKSVSDSLDATIKDIKWAELGQLFSDSVKGILTSINTFIQETDWYEFGKSLSTAIQNVDWSGIASLLFEGIGSILGGIAAFIQGLVEDAWNSVVSWWKEVAFEDGKFTMQGLLNGILEVIKNIGTWIKDNIFTPFANGFKAAFGIASPSTIMAEYGVFIAQGLLNGILSKFSNIGAWVKENVSDPFLGAIKKLFGIASPSKETTEQGEYVAQGFLNPLKDMVVSVESLFTLARDAAQRAWADFPAWVESFVTTPTQNHFDSMLKNVYENFKKTWDNVKIVWGESRGWFESNVTEPLRKAFESLIKIIVGYFSTAWSDTQSIWRGAPAWFETNVISPLRTAFNQLADDIESALERAIGSAKSAASEMRDVSRSASSASSRSVDISPSLFTPAIGNIEIPKLARGGIVDSATIAMIGEKGREAVVPLSHNAEWMEPLREMRNMIDETNRLLEKLISVSGGDTYLDGRLVSDGVFPYYESWEERRGKRIK